MPMNDEQRRFMHASRKIQDVHVAPIQELKEAAMSMVQFYKKRADEAFQKGYEAGRRSIDETFEELPGD